MPITKHEPEIVMPEVAARRFVEQYYLEGMAGGNFNMVEAYATAKNKFGLSQLAFDAYLVRFAKVMECEPSVVLAVELEKWVNGESDCFRLVSGRELGRGFVISHFVRGCVATLDLKNISDKDSLRIAALYRWIITALVSVGEMYAESQATDLLDHARFSPDRQSWIRIGEYKPLPV